MLGKECTSNFSAISPCSPLNQCVHGIGLFFLNSLTVSASSSKLTPTRTKGFSLSRDTSLREWGIMALQGPHQVAQQSSTTTLPLRSLSLTSLPSRSLL